MASLDRPKLRPLFPRRVSHEGEEFIALEDSLGIVTAPLLIPMAGFQWFVRHFDGRTSLPEMQSRVRRETSQLIPLGELEALVARLDEAMVLDGPTFSAFHESYRRQTLRPAAHAGGAYPEDGRSLRALLDGYFARDREGHGPEGGPGEGSALRAIVAPHIDFARGGHLYARAYRQIIEHPDADVYVILGVAHQFCRNRFALTRKDFDTPLGAVPTDRAYVDRLAELSGGDYFEDELAHRTEHSVEFQAVFLRYLLGGRREFSIVPALAGSFHDLLRAGVDPIEDEEVRRFVAALRTAERESGKKVVYIGGIDLSHVGPEFGDPALLDRATLDRVRDFDLELLRHAAANDPTRWFATASAVGNRWRVCGLAATYTMLHAIGPEARGRLLRYDQAVNARRTCGVSFAGLRFEGPPPGAGRVAPFREDRPLA